MDRVKRAIFRYFISFQQFCFYFSLGIHAMTRPKIELNGENGVQWNVRKLLQTASQSMFEFVKDYDEVKYENVKIKLKPIILNVEKSEVKFM